jgi:hypothetical protein
MKKKPKADKIDWKALHSRVQSSAISEELGQQVVRRAPKSDPPATTSAGEQQQYRVTLVSRSAEKEHVRVMAHSLQEAKRHAVASFLGDDRVIGVVVRPAKELDDGD